MIKKSAEDKPKVRTFNDNIQILARQSADQFHESIEAVDGIRTYISELDSEVAMLKTKATKLQEELQLKDNIIAKQMEQIQELEHKLSDIKRLYAAATTAQVTLADKMADLLQD